MDLDTMSDDEMIPHHRSDNISMKNRKLMDQLQETVEQGKFLYLVDVEAYD